MEIPDIVVSAGLVTAATVVLAFVLNQAYAVIASFLAKYSSIHLPPLNDNAKKAVVAGVSVGVTGYSSLALIPAGSSPELLLAYATAVFKASQIVYDKIWSALIKGRV